MTCREIQMQLGAFLAGELSGDLSRSVRRHLASCKACAALLNREDLAELLPVLDETIRPSAGLPARFHARLEAHQRKQSRKFQPRKSFNLLSWSWPARLSAAGAMAVAVIAVGLLFQMRSSRNYLSAPTDAEITIVQNLPLLQDMPIIENLDMLEDFDSIENLAVGPGSTRLR